jgi:hypothetical protein
LPVRQHNLERVDLGVPITGFNRDAARLQYHGRSPAEMRLRVGGRLGCEDGV